MLKRLLALLLSLLVVAAISPAFASDEIVVHHIPEGVVSSDGKFITYNLSQFEELVNLDLQFTALQQEMVLATALIDSQERGLAAYRILVSDLESSVANLKNSVQLKETEIDYLHQVHKDKVRQVRRRGLLIGGSTGAVAATILILLLGSQ